MSTVKLPQAHENVEQACLFRWANFYSGKYPELDLMYHIPNGGKRDKGTAKRLKAEGVKSGVPDICLPVARSNYHGLYIELKVNKNKPTETQERWLTNLSKQDYHTAVCYGWEEASKTILKYLESR